MPTDDFFRARIDQMIDLSHPLAVLARRMPWESLEKALAPAFAHKDRKGRSVPGHDLFGPTLEVAGAGVSPAGRPRLAIRLMVSLLLSEGTSKNPFIRPPAADQARESLNKPPI